MCSANSDGVMIYIVFLSGLVIAGVASQTETDLVTNSLSTDGGIAIADSIYGNNKTSVLLPKCCPQGLSVGAGNCSLSTVVFQPKFNVYKHNATAFDDEPIDPSLVTFDTYYKDACKGQKFPLSPEEDPIILMNGSLLLAGMGEYDGILGHDQFCIDNLNVMPDGEDDTVYTFICVKEVEENLPSWVFSTYITLVIITILLFTSSAAFFYTQDIHGVHKKSFIAFASSMSITYFIIVLMQFITWGCKFFGLVLQFFVVLSFCWLAVLCFDLAWSIHFYRRKEHGNRTKVYIGSTLVFSTLFLIISLINNFTPDIPSGFFKPQFGRTACVEYENQRTSVFFTAIILTLGVCVMSLCYSLIKMNHNRYQNDEDGVSHWRKVSKKYSYMYGRKLIVFVTMVIWIIDAFSDRFPQNSSISMIILAVQAFHGFIVVPLYTLKTLRRVINVNNKPRIENLEELLEVGGNHTITKSIK